jgi:hypothetical protein
VYVDTRQASGYGESVTAHSLDPLVPPKEKPVDPLRQRSVGLPESLWKRIDRLAQQKGYRGRSDYLRVLIEHAVDLDEGTKRR